MIIEFKRAINENVINQGLYYLDWLLDHKGEFELAVLKKYGQDIAKNIEWGSPRLLCIAGDFTKYDIHAVQQINRNIELIRYRNYHPDLFLLELVNVTNAESNPIVISKDCERKEIIYKTVSEQLESCDTDLRDVYESLKSYAEALGDDVQIKILKFYIAFKRINNFASVEIFPQKKEIKIYLKIDPNSITLEKGYSRDVTNVGHWGTGNLELVIKNKNDLEKAKPVIAQSYDKM